MIIILRKGSVKEDAQVILDKIENIGLKPLFLPGVERIVIGAIGDERLLETLGFDNFPQVEEVKPVLSPYKLVSRDFHAENTIVKIRDVSIGGHDIAVMAGPCAIEGEEQFLQAAKEVKKAGAKILRGGAFKPRTSPYSFQGLGILGLKIMNEVAKEVNMPTVTEVLEVADIDAVAKYADAFQVGARNMQNFRLLKELGQQKKPVLLKRGLSATLQDLLLAAEYIVAEGNQKVILCERGIRTFETATRNTLDLNAVPYLKMKSHLPVVVDPSHGTGIRSIVAPMAYAALACGADGLIIEVHPEPKNALSDGAQSQTPEQFQHMMERLKDFAQAAKRGF